VAQLAQQSMSEVSVNPAASGRCEVRGALTFASARRAYDQGVKVLAATTAQTVEVDCGGVQAADSAGLAVLLAWLAWARKHGRQIKFVNLPQAITALARISDVDALLTGTGAVAAPATEQPG
jgi:phospholipid transport system transporter-binding protein